MRREMKRGEELGYEAGPVVYQGVNEAEISGFVGAERTGGGFSGMREEGDAVLGITGSWRRGIARTIKRMGDGEGGNDPFQPVFVEREGFKERRCDAEGVSRGADIVFETGEGEFSGSHSTADLASSFDKEGGKAFFLQRDGGRQTVRSRTKDYGIEIGFAHTVKLRGVLDFH